LFRQNHQAEYKKSISDHLIRIHPAGSFRSQTSQSVPLEAGNILKLLTGFRCLP